MAVKIDPLVVEYCKTKDVALKEKILENYKPLILYIARKLAFNISDVDDLAQVGSIAVFKALDRFDVTREVDFSTFATPNIIGEIKHYFRDKCKLVKIPRKIQELYTKIKNELAQCQQTGLNPTIDYLAEKLEVSEEKILEAMEAGQSSRIVSLDTPAYTDSSSSSGSTLVDKIGTSDKEDVLLNKETLKQSILKLPSRQRRIVYLRFFGGLSQSEIADRLELSQMHISRLLAKALKKLREELAHQ